MRLLFLFELIVPGFRLQRCSVVWIWRGIVLKKQKSALRVAAASVVDAKTKVQSRNRPATTMEPAAAAAFTSGVTRAPLRIGIGASHVLNVTIHTQQPQSQWLPYTNLPKRLHYCVQLSSCHAYMPHSGERISGASPSPLPTMHKLHTARRAVRRQNHRGNPFP